MAHQAIFDNAAVSSNITGLGIQLKQAGQSFTINTPLVVNETDLPVLTAVPVKRVVSFCQRRTLRHRPRYR